MDAPLTARPVVSDADLTQRWVDVLSSAGGPDDPQARTLWVALFDTEGHQLPVIVPVDDITPESSPALAEGLVSICTTVLAEEGPGGWAAMALERPGPPRATGTDLAWARHLTRAAAGAHLDLRPLHLAGAGWVLSTGPGPNDVHQYAVVRDDG